MYECMPGSHMRTVHINTSTRDLDILHTQNNLVLKLNCKPSLNKHPAVQKAAGDTAPHGKAQQTPAHPLQLQRRGGVADADNAVHCSVLQP